MKSTDQRRHTTVSKTTKMFLFGESAISRAIMNQQMLLWLSVACFFIGYSLSDTSSPVNTAVIFGAKVQLNCSNETVLPEDLFWSYDSRFGIFCDIDQPESDCKKLYQVDRSVKGRNDLSFTASENTTGCYECRMDSNVTGRFYKAVEVIVLDAKPSCSGKQMPGFVRAICSIGFSGNWIPELEWRNANGDLKPNETMDIPNNRVTTSVIVPFHETDSLRLYVLTCTVKFSLENIPEETTEKNIPEFTSSCTPKIRPSGYSLNDSSSPLNYAAIRDTKVQLHCSDETCKDVIWRYHNPSDPYITFGQLKDKFSVDESVKGHFDLSFTASAETAGMYICAAANTSLEPFYMVQVTVLDASPTCSGEETSGFVKATCSINFSGFWSPVLEWVNEKGKLDPTETVTIPNEIVTISLSMPFQITEVGTTFRFTCTAKFTLEKMPAGTTETNIPDFTKTCMSEIKPSGDNKGSDGNDTVYVNVHNSTGKGSDFHRHPHSSSVYVHYWHSAPLCLCLVTLFFNGLLLN